MRRPDLYNNKYDGWQVIDATPQQDSGGLVRVGPTPLKAVHDSDIFIEYDVPFVLAEVNADDIVWEAENEERTRNRIISCEQWK